MIKKVDVTRQKKSDLVFGYPSTAAQQLDLIKFRLIILFLQVEVTKLTPDLTNGLNFRQKNSALSEAEGFSHHLN